MLEIPGRGFNNSKYQVGPAPVCCRGHSHASYYQTVQSNLPVRSPPLSDHFF